MSFSHIQSERYSPLYLLAALGAGGLLVTFFMYLMFWVPHPGQPVPVFEDIALAFTNGGTAMQLAIVIAMLGIAKFAILHYYLLFQNVRALSKFKKTSTYNALITSNAESQLMAAPLALAMGVNVTFIVGLVFIPKLWSVVEYLFPVALATFAIIGVYAISILSRFVARIFADGSFDVEANNSFAQLLPGFALSMVAVGLAAPAAMSANATTAAVSVLLSTLFFVLAVSTTLIAIAPAIYAIFKKGTAVEAAPTLMVIVPILTVLGIATLRLNHGLHGHFDLHTEKAATMMMLAQILCVQLIFTAIGLLVLKKQGYALKFLSAGSKLSPGSYALVCPGVALSVMAHFFVNKGLVATGIIAKFSSAYWAATTPALLSQVAMIVLVFSLNKRHFGGAEQAT